MNNDADEEDEEDSSVNIDVSEEEPIFFKTFKVSDNENMNTNNESLSKKLLAMWKRRRVKLIHDYSRVGWMIYSNENIRDQVKDDYNKHDMDAYENLVVKWLVPSHVVGLELIRTKFELVYYF